MHFCRRIIKPYQLFKHCGRFSTNFRKSICWKQTFTDWYVVHYAFQDILRGITKISRFSGIWPEKVLKAVLENILTYLENNLTNTNFSFFVVIYFIDSILWRSHRQNLLFSLLIYILILLVFTTENKLFKLKKNIAIQIITACSTSRWWLERQNIRYWQNWC